MSEVAKTNGVSKPSKKAKKVLEDIYQKKTPLEHILLRPDTYIGSVEKLTETTWVYDKEKEDLVQREVTFVPGLFKIFDEILVNAADHKQKDDKMDTIKIDINQEDNIISVWNNGEGIPVAHHKKENMLIPTMIFGHLLTSSNYDDEEEKTAGGRNGYGAKLCNIFSTKFTVETASKSHKRTFKQVWGGNMTKASDPKTNHFSGSEFTKITFSPDLEKFKMTSLSDDIVGIMSRRAYDIAASTKGVKVFLNGKRVPIKNFKDYVDLYLKDKVDDSQNSVKCVYERVNERWEIAVAISDKGFQHMSFVNSIATMKGGRHVDYVADMVAKNMIEIVKKKKKGGMVLKPHQIKSHLWIFINCLIVNPTFDSQTKENMTLQTRSFGSKCEPSPKFFAAVSKCGIVDAVMMWAKFKEQAQLEKTCKARKTNKIKVPKLEDANDAGTRSSASCTLILTEGDSAKTFAVAGLGVVGRDKYGVFPLKGKVLNTREASHNQLLENAEISNIIKILGLHYGTKYESKESIANLRYGKLMIMTDQDQDGSHIKGLLINFFHHLWPNLLKHDFLEEFITPIVRAEKGKEELCFYSLPEFEEWKSGKSNWHTYKIKYFKGLGSSESKHAKQYFSDMNRHRILFEYSGSQDDHAIQMAFSKTAVEQRKEWLTTWMEECKRRRELGLPDTYLYEKDTKSVNYSDFINKELVLFSNMDNERSIPSLVDGLKPGQRKVLFTCFKRNDKREVKVAQLAGSVSELSAYHHGEVSLTGTIVNLAQNFVGSNNINLLQPLGQFGSRLMGGKDSASPRYIHTQLSSLARFIFHPQDDPLLKWLKDDNKSIEPEYYVPIIPMILVNGAEGIGTGWSTKIPNYNPRDVVRNLKRLIRDEDTFDMLPWYKNFLGSVELLDQQRFIVHGEIGRLDHLQYEVTELPVKTWTTNYKAFLETMMPGEKDPKDKNPYLDYLKDFRDYTTDSTVRFVLTVNESKARKIEQEGPHKVFKLQGSIATSSMVLFDHNLVLKKYENVDRILREFYEVRLKFYKKRKDYLTGTLEAEANKLSNQARFILEKCDGRLTVENKKKKDLISELSRKGYDSDPIKAWKKAFSGSAPDEAEAGSQNEEEEVDADADFDYLVGMPMWNLTKERKDAILAKRDEKVHELETLKRKSPSDLWVEDLDAFSAELDRVEKEEREVISQGKKDNKRAKAVGGGKKKKPALAQDFCPSPFAKRIAPKIDEETRKKAVKAQQTKKDKKVKKEPKIEIDEFDDMITNSGGKSLAARLGNSPKKILEEVKKEKKQKQTKLNFKPKKLTMDTSDEDADVSDVSIDEDFSVPVEKKERTAGRRAAAAKIKYNFSDDEQEEKSDSDISLHSNEGVEEKDMIQEHMSFNDSAVVEKKKSPPPKEKAKPKPEEIEISDTDSEFEQKIEKKVSQPPKAEEKPSASEMFDNLLGSSPLSDEKQEPASSKRRIESSDSDSDSDFGGMSLAKSVKASMPPSKLSKPAAKKAEPKKNGVPKPAPKKGPKKTAAAKRKSYSDSSDDEIFASKKAKQDDDESDDSDFVARTTTGRSKKAVKYAVSDSGSESD